MAQRTKLVWENPTGTAATNIKINRASSVDNQGNLVNSTVVSATVNPTDTEYIDTNNDNYYGVTRLGNNSSTSDSPEAVAQAT